MNRVFAIDILVRPYCEGRRTLVAFLNVGVVVRRVLDHVGVGSERPLQVPPRELEQTEFAQSVVAGGGVPMAGIDEHALGVHSSDERRRGVTFGDRQHLVSVGSSRSCGWMSFPPAHELAKESVASADRALSGWLTRNLRVHTILRHG
jgi:hypothetical protein